MKFITKTKAVVRRKLRRFLRKVLIRLGDDQDIRARKLKITESLCKDFNYTVRYGHFKGLRIPKKVIWGNGTSRGAKLLGIYEKEVLDYIYSTCRTCRYLVDFGAADGYYAVGMLMTGRVERAFCFEITEQAHDIIQENANLNDVGGKLDIFADATEFEDRIPADVLNNAIVICDIEGVEFELFDRSRLEQLKRSVVIIELHEFVDDGRSKAKALKSRAAEFFNVTEIVQASRDPSEFSELVGWNDDNRWLLCSEGRPNLMKWLVLEPR